MTSLEPELLNHAGPKDLDFSSPHQSVVLGVAELRLNEWPTHLTELAAGLLKRLNREVISVNRVQCFSNRV